MNLLLRPVIITALSYTVAVLSFQLSTSRIFSLFLLSLIVFILAMEMGSDGIFERYIKSVALSSIFLIVNLYFVNHLDVLVGPDEVRFNQNYYSFAAAPVDYIFDAFENLIDGYVFLSSSYPILGSLVYPLFYISGTYDPQLATFFNLSLLIGLVSFLKTRTKQIKWPALLLLVSPQLLYHANVYAKDILALTLTGIAFFFWRNKNKFAFVLFLVLATALRPYAPAVIFIYEAAFFLRPRIIYLGALGAILVCVGLAGPVGLINALLTSQYLIISPNPFSFQIERADYLPLYIESWIFVFVYLYSIFCVVRNATARESFLRFISGLLIYACIMSTLGLYGSFAYGFEYEAGSLSSNIVRKKSMMMPFIYIFLYVLCDLTTKYPRRSISSFALHMKRDTNGG